MKVEVSNGELLDKLTILEIKLKNIEDNDKLVNIQNEFDVLNPLAEDIFDNNNSDLQNHYMELADINSQLWKIEDDIRECEIKKIINIVTGSELIEEKGYQKYK